MLYQENQALVFLATKTVMFDKSRPSGTLLLKGLLFILPILSLNGTVP